MSFSLLAVSEHSTHIMSDISVAFLPRKVNGCFGFSWIIPGFGIAVFRHLYEISSFQLTSSAKLVLAYPNLVLKGTPWVIITDFATLTNM